MNAVISPFFLCPDALQPVQRIASILVFEQGLGQAMRHEHQSVARCPLGAFL